MTHNVGMLAAALPSETDPAVARWLFVGGAVVTLSLGMWALFAPTSFVRMSRSTRSGARRTPQNLAAYGAMLLAVALFLSIAALLTWRR